MGASLDAILADLKSPFVPSAPLNETPVPTFFFFLFFCREEHIRARGVVQVITYVRCPIFVLLRHICLLQFATQRALRGNLGPNQPRVQPS